MSPGDDPLAERKKLTFEEAQGSAPLPRQLALGEISQEFRAALWNRLNQIIEKHTEYTFESYAYFRKRPSCLPLPPARPIPGRT